MFVRGTVGLVLLALALPRVALGQQIYPLSTLRGKSLFCDGQDGKHYIYVSKSDEIAYRISLKQVGHDLAKRIGSIDRFRIEGNTIYRQILVLAANVNESFRAYNYRPATNLVSTVISSDGRTIQMQNIVGSRSFATTCRVVDGNILAPGRAEQYSSL